MVHRDLKAENIYMTSAKTVKIGDFGFGTQFSSPSQTLNTFCGSPPYAAPELYKDESYYGPCVDIWAFGVLLYFIVTGLMPFRADTVGKLKQLILAGTFDVPEFLSDSCVALIRAILKQIPQERPSFIVVRQSSWLHNQEFPKPYEDDVKQKGGAASTKGEKEVFHVMRHMGITDEITGRAREDLRNAVCGIFLLFLFAIGHGLSYYSTLHHLHTLEPSCLVLVLMFLFTHSVILYLHYIYIVIIFAIRKHPFLCTSSFFRQIN